MSNVYLKVPNIDELHYRQEWMMEPETMEYNAGYDIDLKGYNKLTGTIAKTNDEMINWYNNWINKEPDKYFAYIYDEKIEEPIGEVYYYLDNGIYSMGIVIQAKYRGKGYSYNALLELEKVAFEKNKIRELSDMIPIDRVGAIKTFKKAGFIQTDLEQKDFVFGKESIAKQLIITKEMYYIRSDCMKNINKDLIRYINKVIDEHYSLNDKGHDKQHVEYVINRSLKFAKQLENINYNMVYVIAAYHDVAHHIDAKKHEELSAQMLLEDKKLKEFFNEDEIKIMSDAVADHRSSLEGDPRTIYGKIVSSADRNTSVEVTLKRCFSYNKKHSPELSDEDLIEKCRLFLLEKFGQNGYARDKMYFSDEEYNKYLDDITNLALDSNKFMQEIKYINEIC